MLKIHGILSYPHLFTARSVNPGDDPKFSVSILIPKNDPQLVAINAEINQAKANAFPSGFPHNGKVCLKDCAVQWPDDPKIAGYYALQTNASADRRPPVVDANLQPVMDPSLVYPGAMAWVAVNLSAYNTPVNKGVGAYVNGVMITGQEGPLGRLDNSLTAEQMFAGVAGTTPAAPAPAPAPTPVPAAPAPPAPPAPAPPVGRQMTAKAAGATYESFIASGWTDEMLIQHGYMLPPGGAPLAFN